MRHSDFASGSMEFFFLPRFVFDEHGKRKVLRALDSVFESLATSIFSLLLPFTGMKASKRDCYFCIGVSKFWKTPIHMILKSLRDKHGLKWLRSSMSYHRFPNLREIFQGDLTNKTLGGALSKDFMGRGCNCNSTTKVSGLCVYEGKCRNKCIACEATCKLCDMQYIGQTQRALKKRMGEHYNDVKKAVELGEDSGSFAAHFKKHFVGKAKVRAPEVRALCATKILWKANPIPCVKPFKKMSCALCMRERAEIIKRALKNDKKTINSNSELYGACKHNPKFHRFTTKTVTQGRSTDDGLGPERVKKKKKKPKAKAAPREQQQPAPPSFLSAGFCVEIVPAVARRRSPRLANSVE